MSLTGNGLRSIRRQDVLDQKSIAVGLKKLVMAHKATLNDTGINMASLVTPTEMSSLGFVNPNASEILAANLKFYRSNLRVVSSHKGLLMDYLSYDVASSSRINFTGFTAEADEIFVITFDDQAKTGITMVDSQPIMATGELAVGVTDFNVGVPYEVGVNSTSRQAGMVLVFRNGAIQFRNTNNGTTGGNYQEIAAGAGLGVIVRFNNAPVSQPDNILVVGLGTAYRPDGSVFAEIENLAGQVDRVIEVLADVSGLDETEFQVAPNSTDLKAFGDQVLDHENRIDALETTADIEIYLNEGNGHGATNTRIRRFSSVQRNTAGTYMTYADSATLGMTITINTGGLYSIQYSDSATGTADRFGVSVNAGGSVGTNISTLTYANGKRAVCTAQAGPRETQIGFTMRFSPGDIIRAHTDGTMNLTTESCIFQIVRVGN